MNIRSSQSGMGIIELVIAAGMLGVIALGAASMFESQHKQVKSLMQKQEMVDLKNLMIQALSKSDVCTWQLKDRDIVISPVPTETAPSSSVLTLTDNTIYAGTDNTSAALARPGKLPGTLSGIEVQSVSFRNIYSTGIANEYKGMFEVSFNSSSLPIAVKPVQVPVFFRTYSATPDRIESCSGVGTGLGDYELRAPDQNYTETRDGYVVANAKGAPPDPDRLMILHGYVSGVHVASAGSYDFAVAPPSLGSQTFLMPVPKGKTWRVETYRGNPANATVYFVPH